MKNLIVSLVAMLLVAITLPPPHVIAQVAGVDLDRDGVIDASQVGREAHILKDGSFGAGSGAIIGVAFGGQVVSIDKTTGTGGILGFSGFSGTNSLAQNSAGVLFSVTGRTLIEIDRTTGIGTPMATLNFGAVRSDVRGLAFSSKDVLFAINDTGPAGELNPDHLFTIDPSTGVGTLVGATGFTGVQGLAFAPSGTLYGWDIFFGLLTIDPFTGVATDVNPAVGGTTDIQSIAFAPDGRLFGARNALYTIDETTGEATLIGSDGYSDVRGMEVIGVPPDVSGCIQLQGAPLGGRQVILRQRNEPDQTTTTDATGCYKFDNVVSGKTFRVIMRGPVVP